MGCESVQLERRRRRFRKSQNSVDDRGREEGSGDATRASDLWVCVIACVPYYLLPREASERKRDDGDD